MAFTSNISPSSNIFLITPSSNNIVARKRKVKFTIQLNIQELLSVSYLNGVLFCKVRLCDGGNHVSYSSKKEVSNSSVSWSTDSPIQFEIKTVQLYTTDTNNPSNSSSHIIVGYEPCFCRISVRKELRGGKSYQKLGYVDYNLSDFIFKHQQQLQENPLSIQNDFCVNRILKEYDSGSSGITSSSSSSKSKNHQRLDNSYLKINIKILETNPVANITNKSIPNSTIQTIEEITPFASELLNNKSNEFLAVDSKNVSILDQSNNKTTSDMLNEAMVNNKNTLKVNIFTNVNSNNLLSLASKSFQSKQAVHNYGHNRSCSNGSIKSNVSFDFLIKNKNMKFLSGGTAKTCSGEFNSTSSSSSLTNTGLAVNASATIPTANLPHFSNLTISSQYQRNNLQPIFPSETSQAQAASSFFLNLSNDDKIEPANIRIIETRIDANDIINQIENELAHKLTNLSNK